MATIIMQAASSVDGQLYTWAVAAADYAGAGYPGDGSAVDPVVVASSADAAPADPVTPSGASGDIQTNDGAGGLGAITPGSGVAAQLAIPIPPVTPAALEIDWAAGNVFEKTLAAGANAITFANVKPGKTIIIQLTSDAGGSTVSWPAGTRGASSTLPTQTSTGVDLVTAVATTGGVVTIVSVQDVGAP